MVLSCEDGEDAHPFWLRAGDQDLSFSCLPSQINSPGRNYVDGTPADGRIMGAVVRARRRSVGRIVETPSWYIVHTLRRMSLGHSVSLTRHRSSGESISSQIIPGAGRIPDSLAQSRVRRMMATKIGTASM
jgi:hypothetical protein